MDRASALRAFAMLVVVSASSTGCVMEETVSVVRVRDPRNASIHVGDREVVPAGETANEGLVARGVLSTGVQTSAAYSLYAGRNDDRSLALRWDTHLPLTYGERLTVLGADGTLTLPDVPASSIVPPEVPHDDRFRLPLCATLAGGTTENGTVEYDSAVRPASACGGDVRVPFSLETSPRDVQIVETTTPSRWTAVGLIALDAAIVLPIALPLKLAGNSMVDDAQHAGPSADELATEGHTMSTIADVTLVTGGILAALCLPTLFAPSRERIVDPSTQ